MKEIKYNAGDFVYDDENKICRISTSYTDKKKNYEGYSRNEDIQVEYNDSENIYLSKVVNPIPLNEELLLKCWFEKYSKDHFILNGILGTRKIHAYTCENNISFELGNRSGYSFGQPKVKHLHQLQNLYYALTQEELPINL